MNVERMMGTLKNHPKDTKVTFQVNGIVRYFETWGYKRQKGELTEISIHIGDEEIIPLIWEGEREIIKEEIGRYLFLLEVYFYEGDSNLTTSYYGTSNSIDKLKDFARSRTKEEVQFFLPNEEVPDDGSYGDDRERFKISKIKII